jgi:DNA invertase Pin-like site-specific DNA recombinase
MELGYARVSTTKQDLDRQIDALTTAGIAPGHVYVDKKSGATTDRAGLKALLGYARGGDVIVVHTLDRLGRTVRDTLNLIHQLRERGIGVRNLADPIRVDSANPDDPMAQLAVVLLALFAQMERTYTLERAAHARAVATAKGRRTGRPSVVTESQIVHAVQLRRDGHTIAEITATGLTRSTLYRHLPARPPEPLTAAPPATDEVSRRPPATPASPLTCPSCGHRPASRAEIPGHRADIAILWLHLDGGGRIAEAHHCAICQPHEHVVSVACADCGDGPLITGQLLGLGDHPAVPALDWLREHGWQTRPELLCPAHARRPADPTLVCGW